MGLGPLGIWEILVIVGVALLIFGPAKLPEIARGVGKAVKSFRDVKDEVTGAVLDDEPRTKPSARGGHPAESPASEPEHPAEQSADHPAVDPAAERDSPAKEATADGPDQEKNASTL